MKERLVIYQVLPRLFGASSKNCVPNGSKSTNGCGRMADFTKKALAEIRSMGVNCIWYTGMLSHASKTDYATYGIPSSNPELVKGNAGSPYAVKDYYDVNPDLATNISKRMDEFTNLVRRTHDEGMKFIMDFIPNHVAAEYVGTTNPFTDENYYPGHLHDGDWTDTAKLNYSCHSTWEKMLAILLFWAEKGVDGFRCDMAELVPCIFWQWAIPQIKARHKGIIFIAEVYNPWEYRNYLFNGHFDYLYDKVGLYDTLKDVVRGQSASLITQCWQNVDDIRHHMVNFLENHDEQRLASQWFASDPIKGRPALLVSALMGTNPFMLYFGQELEKPHQMQKGSAVLTAGRQYSTTGQLIRFHAGRTRAGLTVNASQKQKNHSKHIIARYSDLSTKKRPYAREASSTSCMPTTRTWTWTQIKYMHSCVTRTTT